MGSERWGEKGGKCRAPRAVPGAEDTGQRMWLDLLLKKKKIDVRTTQLTIFMILLHSLLRKLLSPNPNQISFSFK